jgi:hypothetical protein
MGFVTIFIYLFKFWEGNQVVHFILLTPFSFFFFPFFFKVYLCSIKCLKSCVFVLQELYILYNIGIIEI